MAQAWIDRPDELKALDADRVAHPDWFQSHRMLGGVCYVDLFAGDLQGIRARIPYFRELGLTYLHLMPLFRSPAGDNDGGYAISSYREVNPALGTMEELAELADRTAAQRHQPRVGFRVQPHGTRAHLGASRPERETRSTRNTT